MSGSAARGCFCPQSGGKSVPRSTWFRHNDGKLRRLASLSEGAPSQRSLTLSNFIQASGSQSYDGSHSTPTDDGRLTEKLACTVRGALPLGLLRGHSRHLQHQRPNTTPVTEPGYSTTTTKIFQKCTTSEDGTMDGRGHHLAFSLAPVLRDSVQSRRVFAPVPDFIRKI